MVPKAATPANLEGVLRTAGMPDGTKASVLETVSWARWQPGAQQLQACAPAARPRASRLGAALHSSCF